MSDQFIGKVLAEKYQIDSLMSVGNSGNLYHGTHLLMEKPVTVKILPSELAAEEKNVKSFTDEARLVSRLSHPNILNVTDSGSDNGTFFIVYEDATGETLTKTIKRVGRLSLSRANHIVKEVAAALSAAHANKIIHQNLSSQNVLIRRTPADAEDVKVLNFGNPAFDLNDLDYPIEKIEYLAPEQGTLTGKVDTRTDVYALGVMLYEMLAGEVPLTADNGTDLLQKQQQEPPPAITAFRSDLPKEVDDILLTALAKNPTIRYQSAAELADALNQVALAHPDSDEAENETLVRMNIPANVLAADTPEPPPPPQGNIWKTAFIVLAGITVLGASFIWITSGKQTNPTTATQTDANGMPVQLVNPSSGAKEQELSNMDTFDPNLYSNSNSVVTEGGGYGSPWDNNYQPPIGTQTGTGGIPYEVNSQVAPPGNMVYVGNDGSIFMPRNDGGFEVMKPRPANTANVNTQTPAKKDSNSNPNTQPPTNPAVKTTPTPTGTPTEVKPTPTPAAKPTATPKAKPTKTPAKTGKSTPSGNETDTN